MSKIIDHDQDAPRPDLNHSDEVPFEIENLAEDSSADTSAEELPPVAEETDDSIPYAAVAQEPQAQQSTLREVTRNILGGDYFLEVIRKHILFLLFLTALGVWYISNRYAAQQEVIEIANLRATLVEKRNYALTQHIELTTMSRQSNIEEALRANGDTLLKISKEPPFIIQK